MDFCYFTPIEVDFGFETHSVCSCNGGEIWEDVAVKIGKQRFLEGFKDANSQQIYPDRLVTIM